MKASDTEPRPRILYIMGTARSGTTILEIMLSANPAVLSVGELSHVFRDGFLDNKICSCSSSFDTCSFWSQITEVFARKKEVYAEYAKLTRSVEWHANFLPLFFGLCSRKKKEKYIRIQDSIILSAGKAGKRDILLDSSKYPGRALLLKEMYGKNVKVICLTKSPEGLLSSFKKKNLEQPQKRIHEIALYYCYVLFCCKLFSFLPGSDVHFLRYEELIENPQVRLREIQNWAGLDLSTAIIKLQTKSSFEVGHILTGNRLRMGEKIYFEPKVGNVSTLSIVDRLTCVVMRFFSTLLGY